LPSRVGDLHANNINRQFESSACFDLDREAVSEQSSEQDFADATRKQIRLGVPGDGFREEPERAAAATVASSRSTDSTRRAASVIFKPTEMKW
jgi:hypothetical protein